MDTQAIIEDYVNKVARKLPRKLRNDVGLELRTLLTEQLRSAGRQQKRCLPSASELQSQRNSCVVWRCYDPKAEGTASILALIGCSTGRKAYPLMFPEKLRRYEYFADLLH
jgi:hypothetical protein